LNPSSCDSVCDIIPEALTGNWQRKIKRKNKLACTLNRYSTTTRSQQPIHQIVSHYWINTSAFPARQSSNPKFQAIVQPKTLQTTTLKAEKWARISGDLLKLANSCMRIILLAAGGSSDQYRHQTVSPIPYSII
jgi:hypothetical protein